MKADIRTVTGVVEEVQFNEAASMAHFGAMISLLRIRDENGDIVTLNRLLTTAALKGYLAEGRSLTLHVMKFKKNWVFFAIESDGRKLYDSHGIAAFRKMFRWSGLLYAWIYPAFGLLLLMIPTIGWLLFLGSLIPFYLLVFEHPGHFSDDRLRPFLKNQGFTQDNDLKVLT